MRAGKLDRRITIQRYTTTQNDFGEETKTWSSIAHRRAAGYRPTGGDERFDAEQFAARQQVEWRIRFSDNLSDLNPKDRILYPAPDDKDIQNPDAHAIFEILSVEELGRREGFLIKTARRAEQ
jgi:head-tail adaptor